MAKQDQTFQEYLNEARPAFWAFWQKVQKATLAKNGYKWTRDEVKTVYFWAKQAVAVVAAIMLPLANLRGFAGFALFTSLSVLTGTVLKSRLHISDQMLEPAEAFTEGLPAALTTFLPMWIVFNTLLGADAPAALLTD